MAQGSRAKKNWIQGALKKPGSLRKALHAEKGKDIPAAKIEKAAHSQSPCHASVLLRKRANLALTLKGLRKKKA